MMMARGMGGVVDEAKRRLINGQNNFDISIKGNADGKGTAVISLTELQAVMARNDSTMLNSVENDDE